MINAILVFVCAIFQSGFISDMDNQEIDQVSDWNSYYHLVNDIKKINILNSFVFLLSIPISFEFISHFSEDLILIKRSLGQVNFI